MILQSSVCGWWQEYPALLPAAIPMLTTSRGLLPLTPGPCSQGAVCSGHDPGNDIQSHVKEAWLFQETCGQDARRTIS